MTTLSLWLAVAFAFGQAAHAGTLESNVIGLFPKDVSEFGYADLSQMRSAPWFPQLEAQVVPVSLYGFEQLLAAAQLRQTSPIDQVAWAKIRTEGMQATVGVAIGQFDLDAIQSFLKANKCPSVSVNDATLYPAESASGSTDIFFTVLDGRTIAFGSLSGLTAMLAEHATGANLLENESMMTLIDQENGAANFWGVLNAEGAQSLVQQFFRGLLQFSQAMSATKAIHHVLFRVEGSDQMQVGLQMFTDSTNSAVLLSQILQAGVLFETYRSGSDNPDLADVLHGASIAANGPELSVGLSLTADQMLSLVEHNTF